MAGHYQKPIDKKHKEIPFKILVEGKEYAGTVTEAGEAVAFGTPSSFIVRIAGEPRATLSIYRGEWQMNAPKPFVKALSEWLTAYYS
jgi:hypothetical protein